MKILGGFLLIPTTAHKVWPQSRQPSPPAFFSMTLSLYLNTSATLIFHFLDCTALPRISGACLGLVLRLQSAFSLPFVSCCSLLTSQFKFCFVSRSFLDQTSLDLGFPGASVVKNPPANAGGTGDGPGRSPGGGNGTPLQYSCLENPMDGGAWWATVHGVTESWTRLTMHETNKSQIPPLCAISSFTMFCHCVILQHLE